MTLNTKRAEEERRKNFESSDKNIYILIPSGVGLPIRKELADRGFLQCNIRSTDYKEEVSEEVSHSSIKLLYSLQARRLLTPALDVAARHYINKFNILPSQPSHPNPLFTDNNLEII